MRRMIKLRWNKTKEKFMERPRKGRQPYKSRAAKKETGTDAGGGSVHIRYCHKPTGYFSQSEDEECTKRQTLIRRIILRKNS